MCAPGSSSAAANGFAIHTAMATTATSRRIAAPAPIESPTGPLSARSESAPSRYRRTGTAATPTSTDDDQAYPARRPERGSAVGHRGGRRRRQQAGHAQQQRDARRKQEGQRAGGRPRHPRAHRLAPAAHPREAVDRGTKTGRSRVPTRRNTDHAGSTLRPAEYRRADVERPAVAAVERGDRAQAPRGRTQSSRTRSTARSAAGPALARRPTAAPRAGPRATTSPCSPTVSGTARRVDWLSDAGPRSGQPGLQRAAPLHRALQLQRRDAAHRWTTARPGGPRRSCRPGRRARARRPPGHQVARDLGAPPRRRRCRRWSTPARGSCAASARRRPAPARAAPRCPTAPRRSRAPQRVAVGDDDDPPAGQAPGADADDVWQLRSPSTVCALKRRSRRCSPAGTAARPRRCAASASSPGPPGRRAGNAAASVAPASRERARALEGVRRRGWSSAARGGARARTRRRSARAAAGTNAAR